MASANPRTLSALPTSRGRVIFQSVSGSNSGVECQLPKLAKSLLFSMTSVTYGMQKGPELALHEAGHRPITFPLAGQERLQVVRDHSIEEALLLVAGLVGRGDAHASGLKATIRPLSRIGCDRTFSIAWSKSPGCQTNTVVVFITALPILPGPAASPLADVPSTPPSYPLSPHPSTRTCAGTAGRTENRFVQLRVHQFVDVQPHRPSSSRPDRESPYLYGSHLRIDRMHESKRPSPACRPTPTSRRLRPLSRAGKATELLCHLRFRERHL